MSLNDFDKYKMLAISIIIAGLLIAMSILLAGQSTTIYMVPLENITNASIM